MFFHRIAAAQKRRNYVQSLFTEEGQLNDRLNLMNLFTANIKVIIAEEENDQIMNLDWNFLHPNGASFTFDAVVEPFKAEEARQALFCLEVINHPDLTVSQCCSINRIGIYYKMTLY